MLAKKLQRKALLKFAIFAGSMAFALSLSDSSAFADDLVGKCSYGCQASITSDDLGLAPITGQISGVISRDGGLGKGLQENLVPLDPTIFYPGDQAEFTIDMKMPYSGSCSLVIDVKYLIGMQSVVSTEHFVESPLQWSFGSYRKTISEYTFVKAGDYSVNFAGTIDCTWISGEKFSHPIATTIHVGQIHQIISPKPLSVVSLNCANKFKFSTQKDALNSCTLVINDVDHVLGEVRWINPPAFLNLTDIKQSKNWRSVKSGWQIPIKVKVGMLTPIQMDGYRRVEQITFKVIPRSKKEVGPKFSHYLYFDDFKDLTLNFTK